MSEDKRTKKDGEYLSKAAVSKLNERHGWFQYADAQSDVSNAFANNSIHAFLESAKEAQEIQQKTGFSPRQILEQRDELLEVLKMVQETAIDMRGEDFNLTTDQWKKFHEAIAKSQAEA